MNDLVYYQYTELEGRGRSNRNFDALLPHFFIAQPTFPIVITAADYRNSLQESRHGSRGSACLFAPMMDFNVMSEVGDTPP